MSFYWCLRVKSLVTKSAFINPSFKSIWFMELYSCWIWGEYCFALSNKDKAFMLLLLKVRLVSPYWISSFNIQKNLTYVVNYLVNSFVIFHRTVLTIDYDTAKLGTNPILNLANALIWYRLALMSFKWLGSLGTFLIWLQMHTYRDCAWFYIV